MPAPHDNLKTALREINYNQEATTVYEALSEAARANNYVLNVKATGQKIPGTVLDRTP
jgi:hypothetical protein